MAEIFTVRTEIPKALRDQGFVAWVHDARHPDDPDSGASMSWHQDLADAERVAAALNELAALTGPLLPNFFWLPHANRETTSRPAELTARLGRICVGVAKLEGRPVVLDSLLSVYLSLAMQWAGQERVARVLQDCLAGLDSFAAVFKESGR
jgi:hypothetical protein